MPGHALADDLLVACLCAAWCGACRSFRSEFDAAAGDRPSVRFVWIDIEDHPEVLGDDDVETFPTVLIADARRVVFHGAIEPRKSTLLALVDQATRPSRQSTKSLSDVATRVRLHAARPGTR